MADKQVSDKQVEANRRNAQASTGPTSEAGKARSAQNARRHGAYARELFPLGSGPYYESPADFYERAENLIAGFEPEDDLLAELSKRAADALMKLRRLDAFEADITFEAGLPDPAVTMVCGDLRAAEHLEYETSCLKDVVGVDTPGIDIDPSVLEEMDWSMIANLVRDHLAPGCTIPGMWDEEHTPITDEEWEHAARAILDEIMPDPRGRWAWANGLHAAAYAHHAMIETKTKALMAKRILNGPMASLERPRTHLWREFNQAVAQIRQIRKMREIE